MEREFSVRVVAASGAGSASRPDGRVRQKVDYALAARTRRVKRTERRLVTKTIETLRDTGRTRSLAARRPGSDDR
jgi:hypothetical protein